jgi:hypothetical protein
MTGFTPPPYPYERLDEITAIADKHDGGAVDLSIGTPSHRRPSSPSSPRRGVAGAPSSIGTPRCGGALDRGGWCWSIRPEARRTA